ncbi:hypothetical protein NA57DRAFT_75182 [Rhizodiscina lignyota]|uniref:Uncharacterized protein n=1 Tax=Rhizodiscina lignyota TaxID=1504668 RepID=A0A9P4II49_9PEZI|nr:hypothetical protein NA57DRAFT_75182 [Rhizodiscina lignyota]
MASQSSPKLTVQKIVLFVSLIFFSALALVIIIWSSVSLSFIAKGAGNLFPPHTFDTPIILSLVPSVLALLLSFILFLAPPLRSARLCLKGTNFGTFTAPYLQGLVTALAIAVTVYGWTQHYRYTSTAPGFSGTHPIDLESWVCGVADLFDDAAKIAADIQSAALPHPDVTPAATSAAPSSTSSTAGGFSTSGLPREVHNECGIEICRRYLLLVFAVVSLLVLGIIIWTGTVEKRRAEAVSDEEIKRWTSRSCDGNSEDEEDDQEKEGREILEGRKSGDAV